MNSVLQLPGPSHTAIREFYICKACLSRRVQLKGFMCSGCVQILHRRDRLSEFRRMRRKVAAVLVLGIVVVAVGLWLATH